MPGSSRTSCVPVILNRSVDSDTVTFTLDIIRSAAVAQPSSDMLKRTQVPQGVARRYVGPPVAQTGPDSRFRVTGGDRVTDIPMERDAMRRLFHLGHAFNLRQLKYLEFGASLMMDRWMCPISSAICAQSRSSSMILGRTPFATKSSQRFQIPKRSTSSASKSPRTSRVTWDAARGHAV